CTTGEVLYEAAQLTFTLIRFAQGAAHPPRGTRPPGAPQLGDEVYVFAPSTHQVRREDVPSFLAGLSSPAMLFQTTTRGLISLHLLDEQSGDRAASARHHFENQREALEDMLRRCDLSEDSRIPLEFGDEVHLVSPSALRAWSERFAVDVGWRVI